jgi:uncharacterized membrane protein YebE (DUF533 family)
MFDARDLLVISVDTPAEKDYMQRLAIGLRLDSGTVAHIDAQLGVELPG